MCFVIKWEGGLVCFPLLLYYDIVMFCSRMGMGGGRLKCHAIHRGRGRANGRLMTEKHEKHKKHQKQKGWTSNYKDL